MDRGSPRRGTTIGRSNVRDGGILTPSGAPPEGFLSTGVGLTGGSITYAEFAKGRMP